MINFVRIGICLLAILWLTVPVLCQDEPVKPVSERLDEVRASIDEGYANIATLQQHLNNATDAKDQTRIEKLREEIDYSWTDIERLKELEDMLQDLKDKEDALNDGKPRRAMAGGRGGFNSDTSTGSEGARESGFMMDDGSSGDPFHSDSSTGGEGPKRAMPGAENDNEAGPDVSRPPPKPRERPQRSFGGGAPRDATPGAKPPVAPLTSKKLKQLEASYRALIEAGELELAEKVRESMEVELKRLTNEFLEKENEESKNKSRQNERSPKGDGQPGQGGGGLAGTEPGDPPPAAGTKRKSREELIKELEDLVQQLQEENKELREKNENDRNDK